MNNIHVKIESKINDKWVVIPDDKGPKIGSRNTWNVGNNYLLFDMLAGIRHNINNNISPIAKPRGIPYDASVDTLNEFNKFKDFSYFKPSYYLLSELLAQMNSAISMTGFVNDKEYCTFKKQGYPDEWTHYNVFEEISNKQMESIIKLPLFDDGVKRTTSISWDMPYNAISDNFWNVVEHMKNINSNYDNVRMIFWFSN